MSELPAWSEAGSPEPVVYVYETVPEEEAALMPQPPAAPGEA